jgi:hypothetical protein
MTISDAQYIKDLFGSDNNVSIKATIDDKEVTVPLDPANRHYDEIMKQVEAGDLTIADAD